MYDPMVAKLIVWDTDRAQATARMVRALGEYEIGELKTLLPFHTAILQTEQWAAAETCRDLIEDREWLKGLAFPPPVPAGVEGQETGTQDYTVEVSGKRFEVKVIGAAAAAGSLAGGGVQASLPGARPAPRRAARAAQVGNGHGGDDLRSPLQGTVFKVVVEQGQTVQEGALICVIEAMKMENEITAHRTGIVTELPVAVGAAIQAGDLLAVITSE